MTTLRNVLFPPLRFDDYPGFRAATWLFFLFLYLPILILVLFSFNAGRSATVWSGFSLEWYARAIANDVIQQAAMNSLTVAVSATAMATAMAIAAALVLARAKAFPGKTAAYGILMVPLMTPEIVTAVATLTFFTAIGLSMGIGNIILAHTVFCIPFAFLPIRARLQDMDGGLEQAARDLYAGPWACFRHVTLPLLAPGILAGAMLSFIVSIDDFIITLMVAEPGSTTLPLYIYSMVRVGISPEVNAVSSGLLFLSVLIVSAAFWLVRRGQKS